MRFKGQGNKTTRDILTSLTTFPRLKHGTYQMSPMCEPEDMMLETHDIDDLLSHCESHNNKFCCFTEGNSLDDDNIIRDIASNSLGTNYTFRGNFSQSEFSRSVY